MVRVGDLGLCLGESFIESLFKPDRSLALVPWHHIHVDVFVFSFYRGVVLSYVQWLRFQGRGSQAYRKNVNLFKLRWSYGNYPVWIWVRLATGGLQPAPQWRCGSRLMRRSVLGGKSPESALV